jgi:ABC-type amino acid transport substrate-binding protein
MTDAFVPLCTQPVDRTEHVLLFARAVEHAMRTTRWLMTAVLGLMLAGCAGISTAPPPEARQALAPTGKLRVALQQANPLNVVRDAASGQMTGVGFDLGKELAQVRAPSNPGALEALKSGRADVMGSIKPVLFEMSSQWPGSRVLEDRPGIDPHAMVMPKGRDRGLAYARKFIEHAKSQGLVKAAVERTGLRGVVVAPVTP